MPSTNTNTDQTTAAVLERMFTAWETLLLKAAAEHLIGGEHSIIEGAKETLSVPRHNKFPEQISSGSFNYLLNLGRVTSEFRGVVKQCFD